MNGKFSLFKGLVTASAFGVACLSPFFAGAATVTGESGPTPVDTTSGARFAGGSAALAYAPVYSDLKASNGCYVVIKKVFDFGTTLATTSTVVQCEAGTEGDYAFSVGATDSHRVKLLHALYDAEDRPMGETLTADIVLPLASATNAVAAVVDCRTNSLQLVAEAGGPAALAYSTVWTTNSAVKSVEIKLAKETFHKNGELMSAETNVVFSTEAPATGDFSHAIKRGNGGTFKLFCTFKDAEGHPIEDPLFAWYRFPEKFGTILYLR